MNREHRPPKPSPVSPDRITLRPFSLSDLDDFFVWASDPEVARFLLFWDVLPTKESLLRYLQTTVLTHPWYRAICLDARPVGCVLFSPGEGINRCRGEIRCALASAHWGKGIVSMAVEMALGAVLEEMPGLERVEALVAVENRRAQRTLEKAGFTKEGVLRKYRYGKGRSWDMAIYSFLRLLPATKSRL